MEISSQVIHIQPLLSTPAPNCLCMCTTNTISKRKKLILHTCHFFLIPSYHLLCFSFPPKFPLHYTHHQSLVLTFSYTNSIISTPFSDQTLIELICMPKITSPFTMKLSFSVLSHVTNAEKSDYVIHSKECFTVRKIIFTFLGKFIF